PRRGSGPLRPSLPDLPVRQKSARRERLPVAPAPGRDRAYAPSTVSPQNSELPHSAIRAATENTRAPAHGSSLPSAFPEDPHSFPSAIRCPAQRASPRPPADPKPSGEPWPLPPTIAEPAVPRSSPPSDSP